MNTESSCALVKCIIMSWESHKFQALAGTRYPERVNCNRGEIFPNPRFESSAGDGFAAEGSQNALRLGVD